jgi:hypothetical protein
MTQHPVRARVRRYLRKLWATRGGGFYGFVATLMFVYLEVVDITGDLAAVGGLRADLGWLISFIVGNMIDAIMNTVRAAIWPATWLQHFGVGLLSAALFGVTYVGYRGIRPGVLRLLREPGEEEIAELTPAPRPEV